MDVASLVGPTLADAARALGLVDSSGEISGEFFANPLEKLESILSDPTQREGLLDLLDQVLPPATVPDAPSTQKWHPLLGDQTAGNVYVTVDDSADPTVVVGLAGRFSGGSGSFTADLLAELPIAELSGTSFTALAGAGQGPLTLTLNIDLGWTAPPEPIALAGVAVALRLAPLANPAIADVQVTLRGLDLDGKGAHDVALTPDDLGSEAGQLILGLVRYELEQLGGGAAADAKALADHLIPLLGLDGSLPAFPLDAVAHDPTAIANWLRALTTGASPPIVTWLGHLAGLLGVSAPTVTTTAVGAATSWSVQVYKDGGSAFSVVLGEAVAADGVTPVITIGAGIQLAPSGTTPPVAFDADITVLSLPLAGSAGPAAFPAASMTLIAPGTPGTPLIAPGGAFSIGSAQAGIRWDGSEIQPLLELESVVFEGTSFPKIDLANANTALTSAIDAALSAALGTTGAGADLGVLLGITEPPGDPTAPLIDPVQLATHPTQALAQLHRNALLSSAHPWSNYFTALAALIGLPAATGSGSAADPWLSQIAVDGPLTISLAAWNAQTSGNAADPQQLRIGVQLTAGTSEAEALVSAELFGVDLVASGTSKVSVLGGFRADLHLVPGGPATVSDITLSATSIDLGFTLAVGSPPQVAGTIAALSLTTPAGTFNIPNLTYPFPAGFDITNPLAALGINVGDLEKLLLGLLAHALVGELGGIGLALAALVGCTSGVPGLQADFPVLSDPSGPGSLFGDPLGALRAWINQVVTGASSDGSSFAAALVAWAAALAAGSLPGDLTAAPPPASGSGTYDDPWLLPIGIGGDAASGLLWLEPDGPPATTAAAAAAVGAATDFAAFTTAIAAASRYMPAIPASLGADALATGLAALATHLGSSDGVVPVSSQLPTGGTWTTGTAIGSTHHLQPMDATACSQILAQVDGWAAPGSPRTILLLGPAFSDHTTWATLLAQAEAAHAGTTNPAATFNLRVPGVAPAAIDLRPVTVVTDYYTADLQDDGSGDVAGLVAQIGLVQARLAALRPGAPLVLVAHSTAGLAARAYTAANPSQVKGLITLGTPHRGAPLTPLTDSATGEALRGYAHLLPSGVAAGPLKDALGHLVQALDGYLPPAAPGELAQPWPYPISDFSGSSSTDTAGVPALALGGQLGGATGVDLLAEMRTAASATITAFTAAQPTHLACGVRVTPAFGSQAPVMATAALRLDLGRAALHGGAADPPRPAHALTTTLSLSEPSSWLAGGPLSYAGTSVPPSDVRVRSAELGLTVALNGSNLTGSVQAALQESAFHGATADAVGWGDARLASMLGAVFASIAPSAPPAGSALSSSLAALQAFGVAAADAQGVLGISADALDALAVDPIGFLGPKVPAGLTALGFSLPASDVTLPLGTSGLELFAGSSPGTIGLRNSASGAIALADGVSLSFSAALPVAAMTPALSATLQAGPASVTYAAGTVSVAVNPGLPTLTLWPTPTAATVESALEQALPVFLLSTAASALVGALLGPGYQVSGVWGLLTSPGQALVQESALGDGTVLDPAKLNQLIATIGTLPAGLTLAAAGSNPTLISLATGAPIGGVLDVSVAVSIDATRHLAPSGTIGIQTPLGGGWPSLELSLGVSESGITLSVTPGGGTAIELLPTFGGAAALTGAVAALLPQALDGLRTALPAGPILPLALDLATALDLYDSVGGFGAHANQLKALTNGGWMSSLGTTARTAALNAAAALFNDVSSPLHGEIPGTVAVAGSTITWSDAVAGGTAELELGWDGSGPTIVLSLVNLAPGGSPLTVSLSAGYATGALAVEAGVGVSLQSSLGITVVPDIELSLSGSALSLALQPLGSAQASTLSVALLPAPAVVATSAAPTALIDAYAVPLVGDLLLAATGSDLSSALWHGGPTTESVLSDAGLITTGPYKLKTPLPAVDAIFGGVLQSLAPVTIPLTTTPPLSLEFVDDSGKVGVRLVGSIPVSTGDPQVSALFGAPALWLGPEAGVTLYILTINGAGVQFTPEVDARGLGIGFAGAGDGPLVNTSDFRLGAVDAYLALDIDLLTGHVSDLGGGVEIDKLGIPLNLLDASSSSNPVASSLIGSDSSGQGAGDTSAVNPAVDVIAYYLDDSFTIEFGGVSGPVVIPIHASFGPLYLDQIDVALSGSNTVTLGVDGTVTLVGLSVAVIELALAVPLNYLTSPDHWSLDLQGLAVAYSQDPIEISGGLDKNPGPPIEYDGMLSLQIEQIGISIVGSYARPSDTQGQYTSLFLFVAVGAPLGGPPFAFVTGLGGGFGYNRELIVPTDMDNIPSFVLVAAIDDDSLANDPLSALMQMGTAIPPSRGAYWIAAGVRLTTFALINSTVVIAIALDRGFEIDVLGVSRMALPTEDVALVSVELALKARYNSEEGVLSIQAQLTDNSYLFSPDCQLTGGFAFFMWFPQGQFVLTLGGYNPAFTKPAEFPDVPRLGFNWDLDVVVIKGGAYFALTNSCVMAGGSLSATADFGPVKAWFDAYLDFLVSWDPFAYEFDVGVEIGASLSIQICFFGCVTIGVTVSLGASLAIAGPPFHGTASIDAYVTTITVSFGSPPAPPPYITDWSVFAGKYLTAGDANNTPVSIQWGNGVLTPDPPGGTPQPGAAGSPVQVGIEFTLQTTTRMPVTATSDFATGASADPLPGYNNLDVAPMDILAVDTRHSLTLEQQQTDGSWSPATLDDPGDHFTITPVDGLFPEATWHWVDPAHIPAAARTISAVAGVKLDAHVVMNDQSALIPISTLVNDQPAYALPLPLATTVIVSAQLQVWGAAAESLATTINSAPGSQIFTASAAILSGGGVFAENRTSFGLSAPGIPPIAGQALASGRSAPPLVAPITTGLTLDPPGLPAPNRAETIAPVQSVTLEQPLLRAMMQSQPQPLADAPPAIHTSVTKANPGAAVPRTLPPTPVVVAGARLVTVPAADAPRPTGAALRPRAIRNADHGAATGPAQQQAFSDAATALAATGVTLGAGAAHLWDLAVAGASFTVTGDGCVRVVCTDRGGAVIADSEFAATGSVALPVAAGSEMVLVQALGQLPSSSTPPAAGFAALTTLYAPAGQSPAVGWQNSSTLFALGPSRFAARGATLRVAQAVSTRRNGQSASYGTVTASDALAGQLGVETRLPVSVNVVIVALDLADASAAAAGDLALGLDGGTLGASPQRVITGNRRVLIYDVASVDPGAQALTVSVASAAAWTVGGVIGVHGNALDWATLLAGGIPDHFVPDGPIAPGGSLTVSYDAGAGA